MFAAQAAGHEVVGLAAHREVRARLLGEQLPQHAPRTLHGQTQDVGSVRSTQVTACSRQRCPRSRAGPRSPPASCRPRLRHGQHPVTTARVEHQLAATCVPGGHLPRAPGPWRRGPSRPARSGTRAARPGPPAASPGARPAHADARRPGEHAERKRAGADHHEPELFRRRARTVPDPRDRARLAIGQSLAPARGAGAAPHRPREREGATTQVPAGN